MNLRTKDKILFSQDTKVIGPAIMNVINFIVQRNPSEEDSQYFYSDSEINYFKVDH